MKSIILMLVGCLASTVWAQVPPNMDTAKWQQLKTYVITDGTPIQTAFDLYYSLSDIQPPDTNKDHQAEYFSAVGNLNDSGQFQVTEYQVVSEHWDLSQNGTMWTIDQWVLRVNLQGALIDARHNRIVETVDRQVLDHESSAVSPTEGLQVWTQKLSDWESRVPTH